MTDKPLKGSTLALNGIIALVLGLLFIFMTKESIDLFVKTIGIILSTTAAVMMIIAYFHNRSHGVVNVALIIQGVINLGLGIIMIIKPSLMLQFIFLGVGLWTFSVGIFQIIYAIKVRKIVNSGIYIMANGIAFSVIGGILVFKYEAVLHSLLVILGAGLSLLGTLLLFFSLQIFLYNRRMVRENSEENLEEHTKEDIKEI